MYSSQFLDLAISTAAECLEDPRLTPFGAVVVRNGEVLSVGVSSVIRDNNPVAHAEVNAIQSACRVLDSYLLTDCDLYCSGFPCPLCLSAARWLRLNKFIMRLVWKILLSLGFSIKSSITTWRVRIGPQGRSFQF